MYQAAVSSIGMRFSDRPNAIYNEVDAAALLATMSREVTARTLEVSCDFRHELHLRMPLWR